MKKLAGAVNYRYLLSLLLSILFAFLIGAGARPIITMYEGVKSSQAR